MPALARAKEDANRTVCLSNLRQINLGYKSAVDDDSGQLGWGLGPGYLGPLEAQGGNATATAGWFAKTWGVARYGWICPDAPQTRLASNSIMIGGPGPIYPGTVNSAWQSLGFYDWWWWDGYSHNYETNRAGSYAGNSWLTLWGWWGGLDRDEPQWIWTKESQVVHPARTPTFSDAVSFWWFWPMETDLPASNLQAGGPPWFGMDVLTIPRHGSRPSHITTSQPPRAKLPGAINISYDDGHAALVPLENLWQQEWPLDWKTPGKRPGL